MLYQPLKISARGPLLCAKCLLRSTVTLFQKVVIRYVPIFAKRDLIFNKGGRTLGVPLYRSATEHIRELPSEQTTYVMTWSYFILRAIPEIHELNALREVFGQRVGKFLLKSIITLLYIQAKMSEI